MFLLFLFKKDNYNTWHEENLNILKELVLRE